MQPLVISSLNDFVNENIVQFHQRRLHSLEALQLNKLLAKNPYLFKAKNIQNAGELIEGLLDAFLSSSEEKLFGDFLEDLAVYVAGQTCGGHKSSAQGIDLEFEHEHVYYLVSIKSGPNWGNSSQQDKLEQDMKTAVARIKQNQRNRNIQPVLGICYGKTRTSYLRGYMKITGQSFWQLISGDSQLYTKIIEPVGYRAKQHNDNFATEKAKIVNRFTKEFIDTFCSPDGAIDWVRLVEFNSKNITG